MIFMAAVLALVGLVAGFGFRLKVLLAMLALCIALSVASGVANHMDFPRMATTTALALSLLQFGYFLGAILRAIIEPRLASIRPSRSEFSKPQNQSTTK